MTQGDPATSVGKEPAETEVGSVFVSNYPPYSFWRDDRETEARLAIDSVPDPEQELGLYLHIPFCRKRCKFCYFRVFTDRNNQQVQTYLEALGNEVSAYAGHRAIQGRPLKFVYFGGGTPSFINTRDLRSLVETVRGAISWDGVEEVAFECEPGTLTERKVAAIREIGVSRLSLGVENFNDEILQENGRAHLSAEIYRARPWIEAAGFEQLNIDLIAGMIGETGETWKETVEKTVELDPDSVTIYQLELPYNTVYSKRVLDGSPVAAADWETKRAWHEYAIDRLEGAGYEVSSAYTMVKRGSNARFVYRDSVWRGVDLLGVGVSSFSHLNGVHYQNVSSWDGYLGRIAAGELPISRAYTPTESERMTRELILQLKEGHLSSDYFTRKYGVEVLDEFREAIEKLLSRGMLEIVPGGVRLTRQGLLRVDSLLPEFYAQQYRNARYT